MLHFLKQSKSLPLTIIALLTMVIPLLAISLLHFHYPVGDSWENVQLYFKAIHHQLQWDMWIAPHNEHRLLLPRIIYAINYALFPRDIAFPGYASLIFFFGLYVILIHQFSRTLNSLSSNQPKASLWFYALIALIVFPASSYEMWQWQFIVQFPITLFFVALTFLSIRQIFSWTRLLAIIIYSLLGTYSSANGLIIWPVMALLLISFQITPKKTVVYVLCAIIAIVTYEHNTHAQAMVFNELWLSTQYFFTFLGNSTGQHYHPPVAAITGVALFSLYIYCVFITLRQTSRSNKLTYYPWLAFGLFAIGNALIASLTRVQFTVNQAMSGRYVCISILLVLSVVTILYFHWSKLQRTVKAICITVLTAYFACLAAQFYYITMQFTYSYLYMPQEIAMAYNVYLPTGESIIPGGNYHISKDVAPYRQSRIYALKTPQPNYLHRVLSPATQQHLGVMLAPQLTHIELGKPLTATQYQLPTGVVVKGSVTIPSTKQTLSNGLLFLNPAGKVTGVAFATFPPKTPHAGDSLRIFGFNVSDSPPHTVIWLSKPNAIKQNLTRRLY